MNQMKKSGKHTSDRVNVGTAVKHHTSHAAVKSGAKGAGRSLHSGQPVSMSGGGLKAGQKGNNC